MMNPNVNVQEYFYLSDIVSDSETENSEPEDEDSFELTIEDLIEILNEKPSPQEGWKRILIDTIWFYSKVEKPCENVKWDNENEEWIKI